MTTSLLDAFELIAHSEQLQLRLEAAATELAKRPGLTEEKAWLAVAHERVTSSRAAMGDLLLRALRLAELEPLRGDHTRVLQGAVVDALERLHAGIIYAGGQRAPLIEALYWKLKLPALRRCDREDLEKFWTDFQKRLTSTYARRMLADPTYQVVTPALEGLTRAFASWQSSFMAEPLGDEEAKKLRDELEATARRIESPCRQARLLAQAALVPMKELLDSSGLAQKPKRRGPREQGDEDSHALLERDPPDPAEPSPEERAELALANACASEQT